MDGISFPNGYLVIATLSTALVFLSKEKTSMVLLLALSHVAGKSVFITGSSLYSLAIKTHMSRFDFDMSCGKILSRRSF